MAKRTTKKTAAPSAPVPVKSESRICFGIMWFKTEADADAAAEQVRAKGYTYNGGWYHGMACGREPVWDYTDPVLGRLYAVTN